MSNIPGQAAVIQQYESWKAQSQQELDLAQKSASFYSYSRLAIFILALPVIYGCMQLNWIAVVFGAFLLIASFLYAVSKQQLFDEKVRHFETRILLLDNELSAMNTLKNAYYNGDKFRQGHHLFSDDLDIFGANSLYALLNRSRTFKGANDLAAFLSQTPLKQEIEQRREAIEEIAAKDDWRIDLGADLYHLEGGHDRDTAAELAKNLSLPLGFATKPWLVFYLKALPFIWAGIAVFSIFKPDIAGYIAQALFIINLLMVFQKSDATGSIQAQLSYASTHLYHYQDALRRIFSTGWKSELIATEINHFKGKAGSVEILSQLKKIVDQLDYRLNLLPAILLNGTLAWDFRILNKLDNWKKQNTGELDRLFGFIGRIEALVSLAAWSHNHPEYAYAEITDDYFSLETKGLQHPLIPARENVPNDFSLQQGQHVSIITGSNMAGKSTFLRTVGINLVLAYSGTKSACTSLSAPIATLVSYMRIKDTLEESVSTFKAELNRIALILNLLQKGERCFILIDEMLRGTNSKDKLTGSFSIVRKLLQEKTYAMIATHDIKLAEWSQNYPTAIANYYFDIDYAAGDLVFDYKIKAGICNNFNASFLLQQLGIDMSDDIVMS